MKRVIYILTLVLFTSMVGSAQYLAKYMYLPEKYSDPDYKVNTSLAKEFSDVIWRTYTDRDSVLVYSDRYLSTVVDTLDFLESFVVWEESEYALRIVSQSDSGELFFGKVFGEGSIERGWVNKNQMILWPRVLKRESLTMKAIIAKSTIPNVRDPLKPTHKINVPEDEFRIFNILKIDGSNLLLFTTDLLHEGLKRENAFWVNNQDVNILASRNAYIPVWEKILDGESLSVYTTLDASEDKSEDGILFSIDKLNTFTGIFTDEVSNILGLEATTPYQGRFHKVFINNVNYDFQKVILVDLHQFLIYKELIDIFASYNFYDPVDLEVELIRFFKDKGLNIEDIEFMSIGEMLELITGIPVGSKMDMDKEIHVVRDMSNTGRNHLLGKFQEATEIYEDEQKLNTYTFYSDISYYWLPTEWFLPDEIYSLSLQKKEPPAPPARDYKNYDIYYIDGSSVSGTQSIIFDKYYDNLKRKLDKSTEKAMVDSTYGFYTYMSNGINTIKNDYKIPMERTVQDILLSLRDGTYFPNRKNDRTLIESELLLHQIETITESLTLHYYIPERYLREDIEERCYMTKELADRIYSLAMPKNSSSVSIVLHIYNIYDINHLNDVIKDMQEVYYPDSKYGFKIIVERYN